MSEKSRRQVKVSFLEIRLVAAASANKKLYRKQRLSRKYNDLYPELLSQFMTARSKGHHVNFNWLWSRARVIYREQQRDEIVFLKKHVITGFLKRFNIKMRCRQRNKRLTKEAFRDDLRKWHALTRERLIRTGRGDSYDGKWGRFLPKQRFNVDQTPMPFVIDTKRTYEQIQYKHTEKIWIAQPGSGLNKRQCTIQITRAAGEQPRIAIIFRGAGKIVRADEKLAWHRDVDVYWQKNAWADTEFSINWAQNTLAKSVADLERFALFLDNLTAQESDSFKKAVSDLKDVNWYGLKNANDLCQVIDAGLAQMLKILVGHKHRSWLDEGENAERWYGHGQPFSASERRILITDWVGDAWNTLSGPDYDHLVRDVGRRQGV